MYQSIKELENVSTDDLIAELKYRFRFQSNCIGSIQSLEEKIRINQLN